MNPLDEPLAVQTRADLSAFIDALLADLEANPARWENATLSEYLDALARYLKDLDSWCHHNAPNINPEMAQWRLIAVALLGASIYE